MHLTREGRDWRGSSGIALYPNDTSASPGLQFKTCIEFRPFPYIGFSVYRTSDAIVLVQTKYASSLTLNLPVTDQNNVELSSAGYTKSRSVVGELNWVSKEHVQI